MWAWVAPVVARVLLRGLEFLAERTLAAETKHANEHAAALELARRLWKTARHDDGSPIS